MGPGGPHGLQLRWRASFGVRGGFDSLALPPIQIMIPSTAHMFNSVHLLIRKRRDVHLAK